MARLLKVALLAFGMIAFLVGCSQAPGQMPTDKVSSSEPAPSPNISEAQLLSKDAVIETIKRSYENFEALGMTETVISEGETWQLVFDPGQADYQAALFNTDTGASELIFETDYFTVFVAYLMLEAPGLEITPGDQEFEIVATDFSAIKYQVGDGLLVGATGVDFDWHAEFDYQVDPDLQQGLLELAAELMESFDE